MDHYTIPNDASSCPEGYYWFKGEGHHRRLDRQIVQIQGNVAKPESRVMNFFNTSSNEWLTRVQGRIYGPIPEPEV